MLLREYGFLNAANIMPSDANQCFNSYADLVLIATKLFKPTLLAIRMRNLRRTFCSTNRKTMRPLRAKEHD